MSHDFEMLNKTRDMMDVSTLNIPTLKQYINVGNMYAGLGYNGRFLEDLDKLNFVLGFREAMQKSGYGYLPKDKNCKKYKDKSKMLNDFEIISQMDSWNVSQLNNFATKYIKAKEKNKELKDIGEIDLVDICKQVMKESGNSYLPDDEHGKKYEEKLKMLNDFEKDFWNESKFNSFVINQYINASKKNEELGH